MSAEIVYCTMTGTGGPQRGAADPMKCRKPLSEPVRTRDGLWAGVWQKKCNRSRLVPHRCDPMWAFRWERIEEIASKRTREGSRA